MPGKCCDRPRYAGQVSYEVSDPYPTDRTILALTTFLENGGWSASDVDFLNLPPSSPVLRHWSHGDKEWVWVGQWRNAEGSIVVYSLTCGVSSVASDSPGNGPLRVDGTLFTPRIVDAMKAAISGAERDRHGR